MAVSHASLEQAPIGSPVVYVATPAMEHVVLELTLVDEVLHFATDTIQLATRVNLTKSALIVVFGGSHMIINRVELGRIPDDVGGVQNAVLLPFGQSNVESLLVGERRNQARVVARLLLEHLDQLIRESRSCLHNRCGLRQLRSRCS